MEKWYDFNCEKFIFEEKEAVIVFPRDENKNRKWMLKTEYFGAFPNLEIELLKKGYCLANIKNDNRWGTRKDLERKARFVEFISEKYNLNKKCVPIGMSCGGLFAIKFASLYPELVSCIFLEAPVVNILSCPANLGANFGKPIAVEEVYNALGLNQSTLISYRDHPLDHLPNLIKNKIPAVLSYGDCDRVVPFMENALLVEQAYENTDIPFLSIIEHGRDHHPHGPQNLKPVVEFIEKF